MSKNFSKAEAEAKVGKRIRSLVEFAGVPKGTIGNVTQIDFMGLSLIAGVKAEVWDVVIEWDNKPTGNVGSPLTRRIRDWFSKDEYEQFLEEIP